jgi:Mg-chelatase subunit ChlD
MKIAWSTLTFGAWWPVLLGLLTLMFFVWQWHRNHGKLFPDINLISATRSRFSAFVDHLSIGLGAIIIGLLLLVLASPSIEISRTVEHTAREFMILLDSSGSMQADTLVPREGATLNYDRPLQLGLIPVTGERGTRGSGVDSESVPFLARYEVARESIRRFLDKRRFGDRVGVVYFNNTPFVVSIVTRNVAAIREELKWLDDYVALGTLLYRGLNMAINVLESSPSGLKQAMILISDAEISSFSRIEPELDRLTESNISLHLLWLGEEQGLDADSEAFLAHVQNIGGNIVALTDLTNETLDAAFEKIDRLESYSYQETQRSQVDLSEGVLRVGRWLILVWVLLILTIYHPRTGEVVT